MKLETWYLRQGNIVKFLENGRLYKVMLAAPAELFLDPIDGATKEDPQVRCYVYQAERVETTQLLLLQLGFTKQRSDYGERYTIGENPITKDHLFSVMKTKDYFFMTSNHTLNYIDEVQNLYSDLSKQQLTYTK